MSPSDVFIDEFIQRFTIDESPINPSFGIEESIRLLNEIKELVITNDEQILSEVSQVKEIFLRVCFINFRLALQAFCLENKIYQQERE